MSSEVADDDMLSRLISCVTHREAGRAVHCDEPLAERGKEGRRKREKGKEGKRAIDGWEAQYGRRIFGRTSSSKFPTLPHSPSYRPSFPPSARPCQVFVVFGHVQTVQTVQTTLHTTTPLYMCKRTRLEVGEATAPNERQYPLIEC